MSSIQQALSPQAGHSKDGAPWCRRPRHPPLVLNLDFGTTIRDKPESKAVTGVYRF